MFRHRSCASQRCQGNETRINLITCHVTWLRNFTMTSRRFTCNEFETDTTTRTWAVVGRKGGGPEKRMSDVMTDRAETTSPWRHSQRENEAFYHCQCTRSAAATNMMMMLWISFQNNNNINYCNFICKGKRRDTSKLHSVINNQPCSDAEEQTPKTRPSSTLPRLATLVSVMPRLLHSLTQAMAEKLAQFLAQNSTQLKSSAIASRCEAQLTPIYDEVARNIFLTANRRCSQPIIHPHSVLRPETLDLQSGLLYPLLCLWPLRDLVDLVRVGRRDSCNCAATHFRSNERWLNRCKIFDDEPHILV